MFIVRFTALIAVLSTVSCTSLFEPKHADDRYLKGWIFRTCIDYDYRKSCVEDFGTTYYNFSKTIETLNDACIAFLVECSEDNYWEDKYEECKTAILNDARDIIDRDQTILDALFSTYHDDKIIKVFRQDPNMTISVLSTMVDRFFVYIENIAQDQVSIINWEYNENALADTYTGYLIEYEIGEGFYVLLDLIENDNDDRYRWTIIYAGDSLSELHQYYD